MKCDNEACAGGIERQEDCPYVARCNGYVPKITKELLQQLGFRHEEFPDGWFWFLQPDNDEGMLRLSKAMGFKETVAEDLPDTIILQVDEALSVWAYVYGAEVGNIGRDDALNVLSNLLNGAATEE